MTRAQAHAVRVRGDGDRVLVIGHGIGASQAQWDAVATSLVDHMKVVTFDLAGFGDYDMTDYDVRAHETLFGYADDLAALVSELDIRGAVYMGHSLSGMAGLLASAADSELFSRIVTVGASARYVEDPETSYQGAFSEEEVTQILAAIASDFALWAAGFAPMAMGNTDRPALASEFAEGLASSRPDIALAAFRAAFTSDFRSAVPRVSIPALIVNARDDLAVPTADAIWLADACADGRFAQLTATGHFPHIADPAELVSVVLPFIEGR